MVKATVAPIPQKSSKSTFNSTVVRKWLELWATVICAELLSVLTTCEKLSAELLMAR